MPKVKTTPVAPSRHKGQKSLDDPLYLTRIVPTWAHPQWVDAQVWRNLVQSQLTCMDCKETLIGYMLSLDWKIEPRDSEQRDELKDDIKYYTEFFENTGDYEYSEIVEWMASDYLDLPFGGAAEVGREGDDEEGRLLWLELLDGGTMYPTLNADWPYAQSINGVPKIVYFPKHAINRIYMSPRTDIRRKGWGMAPPEKIYFALQLLSRGDIYYANLLLDSPEAGILDLLDMSKESAEEWVTAWRTMLTGIDPYKIPVLYEHTSEAKFIPFTRNPVDISFNNSIARYDALLCAGYGLTPSDISLGGSGQGSTLAGSIRDERKSKRLGFGRMRKKMQAWFTRLLPSTLTFKYIDIDDEVAVAIGRARLAQATAAKAFVDGNMFTEEEMRSQAVADGLITVSVPESLPAELKKKVDAKNEMAMNPFGANPNKEGKTAERPSMLGRPVSPGQGGWGETAARSNVMLEQLQKVGNVSSDVLSRLMYLSYAPLKSEVEGVREVLRDKNELAAWRSAYDGILWDGGNDLAELTSLTTDILAGELDHQDWWDVIDPYAVGENLTAEMMAVYDEAVLVENKRSFVFRNRPATNYDQPDAAVVADWVQRTVPEYRNEWKLTITKAIISGFRDFLLEHPDVIVEDAVFMPDALSCVNDYLQKGMVKISNKFAQEASDIIITAIRKAMKQDGIS